MATASWPSNIPAATAYNSVRMRAGVTFLLMKEIINIANNRVRIITIRSPGKY